jgi:Protein of unknown function (DUF2628)
MGVNEPKVWIPRELYADFCGEKDGPCLRHYDKARIKANPLSMSFNWLAILCLPAWLAYRQRWQLLITLTVVSCLANIASDAFGFSLPIGAYGGVGVALGLMAHGFLLTDANHRYGQLLQQSQDEASIQAALANAAAGRPLFAVLGVAGSVAVSVALSLVSEILFGARGA